MEHARFWGCPGLAGGVSIFWTRSCARILMHGSLHNSDCSGWRNIAISLYIHMFLYVYIYDIYIYMFYVCYIYVLYIHIGFICFNICFLYIYIHIYIIIFIYISLYMFICVSICLYLRYIFIYMYIYLFKFIFLWYRTYGRNHYHLIWALIMIVQTTYGRRKLLIDYRSGQIFTAQQIWSTRAP